MRATVLTALTLCAALGAGSAAWAQDAAATAEQRIQAAIRAANDRDASAADRLEAQALVLRGLSGEALDGGTVGGAGAAGAAQVVAAPSPPTGPAGAPAFLTATGVTPEGEAAPIRRWGAPIDFRVTFARDSAFLRPDAAPTLAQLCALLNARESFRTAHFVLVGHADRTGSAEYNRALSAQRAEAVRRWLTRDCGVEAERLTAVGVGFDHPLPDAPPVGEAQRRVEVQMTRPGGA